jgi:hypothetical protein
MYNNFIFSQGFSKWFFQFCYVATMAKIWLQVSEDSRHFQESCYALVTSKNLVSKYGNFHVLLLQMWQTERHLKGILQQQKKKRTQCPNMMTFMFFSSECDQLKGI